MTAEAWGRVRRGVVWHLITGPDSTLCEGGLFDPTFISAEVPRVPYVEVSMGLPPMGGRPCPRCVAAVDDLTITVIKAVAGQEVGRPCPRPVEDVDLLGALPDLDDQAPAPSLPSTIEGPLGYALDVSADDRVADQLGQPV